MDGGVLGGICFVNGRVPNLAKSNRGRRTNTVGRGRQCQEHEGASSFDGRPQSSPWRNSDISGFRMFLRLFLQFRVQFLRLCVSDQLSRLPSLTLLPEKRILEHVLDTLQRKDAYEIFAEPVDPNEVEEYYTVIKETMDFATMRAKLHEGMDKTLEQFEDMVLKFSGSSKQSSRSGPGSSSRGMGPIENPENTGRRGPIP